ncbi:ML domain-containing protein, partial [Mycobacterium kansasii]
MANLGLKFVLFLWVCFAVSSIFATPVRYCDKKGKYAVKVKGVKMNPDPVVAGEQAEFKISATSGKSISGG